MLTLLEKIEENAAKRLKLPPDRKPAQELARYKIFLKVESHRLKILHRAGAGGREVCRARAAMLDVLLRYIVEAVNNSYVPVDKKPPALALIAIGGYGRAELNPHSDIDIMFLHDGEMVQRNKLHPYLEALTGTGGLLYTLYDIGIKVGHSVRSLADCVTIANTDMQSKTSLIEARLISGDRKLFEDFQKTVVNKCVKGHEEEYIAARLEDQATRRAKFGNSACMLEPNIKNGSGGLRDYQNLLWMAFFKYRVRTVEELVQKEFLGPSEAKQIENAYDFLLRVRTDLHYQVNRPVDALPKSLQPAVAHNLGYTDRSPSMRLEKFMRVLYTHMRNIYLITRTLEQRMALLPQPNRMPTFREILRSHREAANHLLVDGFKIYQGQIYAASNRVFRDQPRRLMRVFLHTQQRGVKIHPDLAQLIRNQLSLVNREFLADRHVHETFLEILNQRGNVAPILRAMHEVDFLGKYLPEFGKLTCLVQHEFYHQYAADEHTLICLEKLDRVWEAKEPPFSDFTEIFRQVERPFVLYLALLLHDSGKANPGSKHEDVSADLALRVARRLGLDLNTTKTLILIIKHHLLMVQISQRRDMDDPSLIRNFASAVQSPENLDLLTIHTFADSLGTSDKLWNGFKNALLWTLYRETKDFFEGFTVKQRVGDQLRESLTKEVRHLTPPSFGEEELQAHFHSMPDRYFKIHNAKNILTDLTMAHRFMHLQLHEEDRALEPVITWHNEPDRGYTSVKICTWDRARLFSKIAGSLTAAGLNILSAQIFSRNDGIIIDTFFINDAATGKVADRTEREEFERILNEVLNNELELAPLIKKRTNRAPIYQSLEGEQIPTSIWIDNESSDDRTVIEVETEDRVGLLFTISQVLAALKIDISVAKICTEKGAAIDVFYVGERNGHKIIDPERHELITQKLREAIAALDLKPTAQAPSKRAVATA